MTRKDLISNGYLELQKRLHDERPDYGANGHRMYKEIARLAEITGLQDILDYGCGKQTLANALPQYNVKCYDPVIPYLAECPDSAEFVVCSDVMEHIEEDKVDAVLDHIKAIGPKLVFFHVATVPAQKIMADGRNAHICLHESDWWLDKLRSRWRMIEFYDKKHSFNFVGTKK